MCVPSNTFRWRVFFFASHKRKKWNVLTSLWINECIQKLSYLCLTSDHRIQGSHLTSSSRQKLNVKTRWENPLHFALFQRDNLFIFTFCRWDQVKHMSFHLCVQKNSYVVFESIQLWNSVHVEFYWMKNCDACTK